MTAVKLRVISLLIAATALIGSVSYAQEEQDDISKAMDSTATQWSYQLAYQAMPDYFSDTLDDGTTRRAGTDDYIQFRIVAPLVYDSFTVLPRLTLRHYENSQNSQGQSGMGNTELFGTWPWP